MSSNTGLHETFKKRLEAREKQLSRRKLTIADPSAVDFSSNDFLSLSHLAQFRSEYFSQLQKAKAIPLGSGGSRLLDGNSKYIEQLERDIAEFHDGPAGLIFNSGFDANAALFSCVPQPGDVVIYDEFIHASVHEGMRLSRARMCLPFEHNSLADLRRVLTEQTQQNPSLASGINNIFVAVETVYSMDGDVAPLKAIVELLKDCLPHENGHVIIDEAHSTGVYGENGRGLAFHLGLQNRLLARLHTFGKALSSPGAIVLCSPTMREYLINYARSLIYTTAPGLPSLAMIASAYRLMRRGATTKAQFRLWKLIDHFHMRAQSLPKSKGLSVLPDPPTSPIFSLQTASPKELADECQSRGLIVRPVVHPTVPKGTERVRVCLHAGNKESEIDHLLATVSTWLERRQTAAISDSTPRARL